MRDEASRWITTSEAAQRLGVKRATLYAYVSRGLLHSERRPGQQESLFDRAEIDAVASTTAPRRNSRSCCRFRASPPRSAVQLDGDLLLRGVPSPTSSTGCPSTRRPHPCSVRHLFPAGTCATRDPAQRHTASPAARAAPACVAAPRRGGPRRRHRPGRTRRSSRRSVRQALAAFDQAAAGSGSAHRCRACWWPPCSGHQPAAPTVSADASSAHHAARPRPDGIDDRGEGRGVDAGRDPLPLRGLRRDVRPLHGAAPMAARALLDDPPGVAPKPSAMLATAACPASATSSTPTATRAPSSSWPPRWRRRGTARLRRRVEAVRRRRRPLGSSAQHRPRRRGSVPRSRPADRRRRSRLPGRPLPWAHRACSRYAETPLGGAAGRPPAEPSTEHPRLAGWRAEQAQRHTA